VRRIVPYTYLTAALVVVLAGCGTDPARIKGRVLDNGQPLSVPGSGAPQSIVFESLGGEAGAGRMYSAMLNPDGTFELVAAGGSVPPGEYRVSFDVTLPGKDGEKFKRFRGSGSPLRRELKPGSNDLTIDLSKPEQ
jgi:hypothetical protein